MDPAGYLPVIEPIAREAGAVLRDGYECPAEVSYKGAIDLVTQYDTASEALIVARLRAEFPQHDLFAEEAGALDQGAELVWLIDPLDGTTNFAHGFPAFAVSIALAARRPALRPLAGVVYDPLRDELFAAARGAGATLNGRPLRVSAATALDRSLVATGFPYDVRTVGRPGNNLDYFAAMQLRAQGVRRAGAAALDLVYVAAGRFDGYWESGVKPWDIAAAVLLVEEAGGRVTDFAGAPLDYSRLAVLATNGRIHAEMLAVLAAAGPGRG